MTREDIVALFARWRAQEPDVLSGAAIVFPHGGVGFIRAANGTLLLSWHTFAEAEARLLQVIQCQHGQGIVFLHEQTTDAYTIEHNCVVEVEGGNYEADLLPSFSFSCLWCDRTFSFTDTQHAPSWAQAAYETAYRHGYGEEGKA